MAKKKILVVDDEEHIRRLLSSILSKDYAILIAKNGEEAVDIARRETPDLILMDILMPKVDGLTACHTLKKDRTTGNIPVVMLSGVGYELNMKLSQKLGADAYITKPFSTKGLRETVGQLINKAD